MLNGEYPYDIITIDVYHVGMDSFRATSADPDKPFTKVLVVADNFSRGVITIPFKGDPTSKHVAMAPLDLRRS